MRAHARSRRSPRAGTIRRSSRWRFGQTRGCADVRRGGGHTVLVPGGWRCHRRFLREVRMSSQRHRRRHELICRRPPPSRGSSSKGSSSIWGRRIDATHVVLGEVVSSPEAAWEVMKTGSVPRCRSREGRNGAWTQDARDQAARIFTRRGRRFANWQKMGKVYRKGLEINFSYFVKKTKN